MLIPGVGGKRQSMHMRKFGPFASFDEAKNNIEKDFESDPLPREEK